MFKKALIAFAALCICCSASAAIVVSDSKARATFPSASTGAAYLTLNNTGESDEVLTRVSVSPDIAERAEIHTMLMDGDMMQMRELEAGLPLPAKQSVQLLPGGNHLMLIGLTGPLEPGNSVAITLYFANTEPLTIDIPIAKM